ncbi:unnamed protein product [Auanema sp. JU1783]|nr:unnamed protein product [Auanema sp. JU1783]
MGKKTKIGKQRRDKYYKLAKEAGFRSRAAFKLTQLNKRFEFLQNARVTVDLCAAPGGWMQVAQQNMPVSSLIIGVDLAPIKPIANCIGLQGDITTEQTRQAIKKEMNNWDADCVLHDGAPNVGMNWIHDAFQQNCLVLSALKLATQILRKNGTFVTKVFRSNDYSCLIKVFEKLFKEVHVWKPAASRLESAEIFVVCERYLKPSKVPSEYLDHKKVFSDPHQENVKANPQTLLLSKRKERKAKAEGYDDSSLTVYTVVDATAFIQSKEYLDLLASNNKIILDQEKWKTHPATTEEIVENMNDLKVCGPRELRVLLRWRKTMRDLLDKEAAELEEENAEKIEEKELNPEEIEDMEMAEIDALIAKASAEEKTALKRKKKKMLKAKADVIKRRELKMIIKGDQPDIIEDLEIFSLRKIAKARELQAITNTDVDTPSMAGLGYEMDDEEGLGDGEWETIGGAEDEEEEDELEDYDENGLLVSAESFMGKAEKVKSKTDQWFEKDEIAGLISDDDDEDQLDAIEKIMKKNNKNLHENTVTFDDEEMLSKDSLRAKRKNDNIDSFNKKDEEESDEDDDQDENEEEAVAGSRFDAEMDWEEVEDEEEDTRATKRDVSKPTIGEDLKPKAKKRRLTPEELAIGEQLIYSSKRARELEELGWNRYTNNDEGLPDWFVEDEKKHNKKELPVTKEQVQRYRERLKELNAQPCKKVAQAKARKQKKLKLKMERAKKQAEGVVENENLEHGEKIREMKKIYAKAHRKEEKKVELVRMTKGTKGRKQRPNGRYKLVDSRMKKDLRSAKAKEKTKGRGKVGKGSKAGRGGKFGKPQRR